MSTLRTNALEGVDAKNSITIVAGAGNITTTSVQEGLAKQWAFYNQQTPAVGDSFNTGSITDSSTGVYIVNFTNNMSSTNYSANANSLDIGAYYLNVCVRATFSTSAYRVDNMRQDFSTMQDPDDSSNSAHGDLA